MSTRPSDRRSLLRQESSDVSDTSIAIASPTIPLPHQRHTYARMGAGEDEDSDGTAPQYISPVGVGATMNFDTTNEELRGLGIMGRTNTIPRVPVGGRRNEPVSPMVSEETYAPATPPRNSRPSPNSNPSAPNSSNPLLSPAQWTRHPSGNNFTYGGDNIDRIEPVSESSLSDQDIMKKKIAFAESIDVAFGESGDERGRPSHNEEDDDHDYDDRARLIQSCPASQDIHSSRKSWLSISILTMSIYSTIWSAMWLCLSLVQPRYGRMIHTGGSLNPDTASILFALFAKSIELSFVTVFVTFLGQVLTRRSLVKASRGVTIAELSMRTWVIQPGFMITHIEHLRHVGLTIIGLITFTAAVVAMFYTTASDALVSPHLRYGKPENRVMQGLVKASYANPLYVSSNCQTPISSAMDPTYYGSTCLDLMHAGEAYHNSQAFMETWSAISKAGEGVSINLPGRPQAPGMLFDNTTVVGAWVATNSSNMTASYIEYKRIINNVTLAMPHAGVFSAARDPKNGILQPEELAGVGEYSISASVVSPTVNVLCVNMNETELAPIVYTAWPNAITNTSSFPNQKVAWSGYQADISALMANGTKLNKTAVDDIFQWGFDKHGRYPPVFPMYPIDYNSVTNISVYKSDSIYLLIKPPSTVTPDYTVCQLRSYLNTNCSTRYSVSGLTGGHLEAHCEDRNDATAYTRSVPDPPVNIEADWRNIGSEWMESLSLNTGISNANSSTSRLLSQLIVADDGSGAPRLSNIMPSMAEHLAVMAGNTLLISSTDASFWHFWNYTTNILSPGSYESFNASLSTQEYTSGLTQRWQGIFYIVLFLVFITNVCCLVYFFLFSGLVTDYTETQNLFALAVNSPPSNRLHGSCGAGPQGEQLNVDWHIKADDQSGHFFIKEGGTKGRNYAHNHDNGYELNGGTGGFEPRRRRGNNLTGVDSYSRLSSKRASWL